jgi:hypothetical protein
LIKGAAFFKATKSASLISGVSMNTSIVFPWDIRNFQKKVVEAINKIPNGVNDYCAGKWCKYCPFKGSLNRSFE